MNPFPAWNQLRGSASISRDHLLRSLISFHHHPHFHPHHQHTSFHPRCPAKAIPQYRSLVFDHHRQHSSIGNSRGSKRGKNRSRICATPQMTSVTPTPPPHTLVSASWLKNNYAHVKVLDATWYVSKDKSGKQEFLQGPRLPGAQYFDLNAIADTSTTLPHMLPSEHQFSAAADALGITNEDTVVIYDRQGLFSAPRAWWTWHAFGHAFDRVAVLDGGLPAWVAVGGEVDVDVISDGDGIEAVDAPGQAVANASASAEAGGTKYRATLLREELRSWQQVLANIEEKKEVVVDARPAPRWRGEAPEPRPGLKLGKIPGSANIPWDAVVGKDGKMKSVEELKGVFDGAGVVGGGDGGQGDAKQLVFSCGSGTTACVLALAAKQIDPAMPIAIYDGSWSEWGGLEGVPVV